MTDDKSHRQADPVYLSFIISHLSFSALVILPGYCKEQLWGEDDAAGDRGSAHVVEHLVHLFQGTGIDMAAEPPGRGQFQHRAQIFTSPHR